MNLLRVIVSGLLCVGLATGCSDPSLTGTSAGLHFEPTELVLDARYVGEEPAPVSAAIINEGRASLTVRWAGLSQPFAGLLPTELPPGRTELSLELQPTRAGDFRAELTVDSDETEPVTLRLSVRVLEVPSCVPSNPCRVSRFDVVRKACVESNAGSGTSCTTDNSCLINGRCEAGRCVGDARDCRDDNACTVDVCYPNTGCEHLPAPPCPGDGACMEGICDPAKGCGLQPREDGVSCGGTTSSCTEVSVCIEGACVNRDPPDGYICAEASPCSSEGRCLDDVCVRASPKRLDPSWTFDAMNVPTPDGGDPTAIGLHDFVLEPSGAMSLSGFFDVPAVVRANVTPKTVTQGTSRRCILWGARYVCADYPASPNGKVSAVDLATGEVVWTFDIRSEQPQFLMVASTIFLARLVVQDNDRLAAVFEAYPRNVADTTETQCRRYFVAVMNAAGELVQAQQVEDPLLDECNHPHPYGAASDALGNLYVSFSPTVSAVAPLVPDDTTLIMSYSRDGVFRWKRVTHDMRGGELGVAKGLLYAEYSPTVLDAVSGAPAFSLPMELGRAVVSSSRLVPAPLQGGQTLRAFEAGTNLSRWISVLPAGRVFASDQLRLATWATSKGPRTVALTWVGSTVDSSVWLSGVDVFDGSEAFTCPISRPPRTPTQLFELATGSMAVMSGALDTNGAPGCSKCDPPLAGSSASFSSYLTPTLSPANEPWVGTFGGPGHDHREN